MSPPPHTGLEQESRRDQKASQSPIVLLQCFSNQGGGTGGWRALCPQRARARELLCPVPPDRVSTLPRRNPALRRLQPAHRGPLHPEGAGPALAQQVPEVPRLPGAAGREMLQPRGERLLQGGLLQVSRSVRAGRGGAGRQRRAGGLVLRWPRQPCRTAGRSPVQAPALAPQGAWPLWLLPVGWADWWDPDTFRETRRCPAAVLMAALDIDGGKRWREADAAAGCSPEGGRGGGPRLLPARGSLGKPPPQAPSGTAVWTERSLSLSREAHRPLPGGTADPSPTSALEIVAAGMALLQFPLRIISP